jgi:diacylglycerol kinase
VLCLAHPTQCLDLCSVQPGGDRGSFWLQRSRLEWAVILIAISMVWMAELLNTALEAVVDLASPQQHYLARIGKDVGAAAVLTT